MRGAGHVAYVGREGNSYKNLVGKPEGKTARKTKNINKSL
jgi:hypothetical protein